MILPAAKPLKPPFSQVGLYAAALDERIAGVASVCGFGSLRASSEGSRGGGLRRIFELHQLQPRLGFFVDKPAALPYDYDDVLSLILAQPSAGGKQRKVFVLSPQDDRVHNVTEVERLILRLTPLARQGLTLSTPAGINRLDDGKQHAVVDWLHAAVASADIKPVAGRGPREALGQLESGQN